MPKKAKRKKPPGGKRPIRRRRTGLPDPTSVVSESVIVSPKGRSYRVLRTIEQDAYDPPPRKPSKRR